MSSKGSVQFWAACSAAFACGATLGAWAMHQYLKNAAQSGHLGPTISLSALQGLPVPSGGGLSPTASVSSYSLPPTPRLSRTGSSSGGNTTLRQGGRYSGSGEAGLRMVFVVRRDLQWSKQKLSVMTAHAALALFKKLYRGRHPALTEWELGKGPKLVLRADSEQQLEAALKAAREAGVPYHSIAEASSSNRVSDSGHTSGSGGGGGGGGEFMVPQKTRTILALGPMGPEDLSRIAGGLVLL